MRGGKHATKTGRFVLQTQMLSIRHPTVLWYDFARYETREHAQSWLELETGQQRARRKGWPDQQERQPDWRVMENHTQ